MKNEKQAQETEALVGQVVKLKDLLDYQAASIVSRTIVTKDTGTITIFAFDKDEGLSEHTAPFDALVYIMDGTAEVTISGKPHRLGEGQMIIMPADEPHALKAEERFKMMLVMIKS
jgi:quercetin dioxygenase-like cupin family protein